MSTETKPQTDSTRAGDSLPPYVPGTTDRAPASKPAARKPKAPTYTVMRRTDDGDHWVDLGVVKGAGTPREAIVKAASALTGDEQFGTFRVMLADAVREKTREKRVVPERIEDEWK